MQQLVRSVGTANQHEVFKGRAFLARRRGLVILHLGKEKGTKHAINCVVATAIAVGFDCRAKAN